MFFVRDMRNRAGNEHISWYLSVTASEDDSLWAVVFSPDDNNSGLGLCRSCLPPIHHARLPQVNLSRSRIHQHLVKFDFVMDPRQLTCSRPLLPAPALRNSIVVKRGFN